MNFNTKKKKPIRRQSGFTLIEILIVIGLIAVLAGVVLVAINPTRQFAQGRDAQRTSNLNAILNAIGQRIADNKGFFAGINPANNIPCPSIPATTTMMTIANATSTWAASTTPLISGDLSCLVPTYLERLPNDPSGTAIPPAIGYLYFQDANGRVHVLATTTEPSIPRLTPLEVVR
jgi:type IV pilus assembly protein PilA